MKIKQNLEVFIGTRQWLYNSSITPEVAGTIRIYHDEQKSKWILDSENHSYNTSMVGTNSNVTWGHFEEYSGDFNSADGMVFQYFKNFDSDISTYSVKLIPYSAIQKRDRMYVPALYGNLYVVNNQNDEEDKCGIYSIPKQTFWYNPLQPQEQRKKYYISVQPQSYTILF